MILNSHDYQAAAHKGHATRKRKAEAIAAARNEALIYADGLRDEIKALEAKLTSLQYLSSYEVSSCVSASVTGKRLLRADEIVKSALPWFKVTGVYFLLEGSEIVYVGQSHDVYHRISTHKDKKFSSYAYVPCEENELDVLESLYIHCLQPKLNGEHHPNLKCAPLSLTALLMLPSKVLKHLEENDDQA